jgi:hypothetical protein
MEGTLNITYGRSDAPSLISIKVHRIPANDNGGGRVRTHADEEEPGILGREVAVDRDQDRQSDDDERNPE